MVVACLEALGMTLSAAGWLLVMLACGLPTWKVNAFIDGNIVVAQALWDGLWMTCVVQSTGHMQCKLHDSVLALAQDLQAARALTLLAAVLGGAGLVVTTGGARWTTCISDDALKRRLVCAGGVVYALCGLLVLVPVCWIANNIIVDFHNPKVPPAQKREIGASIYIGWAAAALLLAGGTLLCCSASRGARSALPLKLAPSKTAEAIQEFEPKNYV